MDVFRDYGIVKKFSGIVCGISSVGRAPALQAGGHEFDSRILHSVSLEAVVYLENCIQRKSIDDKKYLINQDIRGNVIKNINDDSIESFEENEVKKIGLLPTHVTLYMCR